MNQKAKRKSPIVLIFSISIILLIAILGTIYYKYNTAQSSTLEEPVVPSEQEEKTEPDNTSNPSQLEGNDNSGIKPQEEKPLSLPGEQKEEPNGDKSETPSTDTKEEVILENGYIVGQEPATDPTYVKGVLIVNKKIPLPASYNKGEDSKARSAFDKMAGAAKGEGIELVAFSGFRSYEYQKTLYDRYVKRDGKDAADRYSARPGYSEHQTGLAFDIGEKGQEDLWLTNAFGETKAGQWLAQNSHKFGFILRYPKGKEQITGFMHESWHFRYLEGDLATKVYEAGVTLEEYLGIN
ncbi:M15 family metallopeptidase [Solibacillus ferritrahens]|uniref:M15 family metallopeptidase n=1 Tax=Solibacillus ferritrahens TaxID=3098620 RepID=UPI00300AEC4F